MMATNSQVTPAAPPAPAPVPVPAASPAKHLAFIDALRGWAFLAVLMVHVHQAAPLPQGLSQYGVAANYGVQLFFVISAVTLIMSLRSRMKRDRKPIAAFFVRRFFRIAPLFWLAIPTYLAFYGPGPTDQAPYGIHAAQVIATASFLHGWHPTSINSVVPGGWSIAVEMNFYLLFPLCFSLLTSLRRSVVGCVLAFIPSVGVSVVVRHWLAATYDEGLIQRFTYYWLPREMPVFLLGFILYFLLQEATAPSGRLARYARPLRASPEITVAVIAVMGYVSSHLPLAYFWFSCAFVVLALGLALRAAPVLVNPVTQYIGKVSYSAYITHFLVLGVVGRPLAAALQRALSSAHPLTCFVAVYVVSAACTVVLSSLTYRFIETPGQKLGAKVIERLGYGAGR